MSTHADSATGAASAFKSETRTIRHRQPQKARVTEDEERVAARGQATHVVSSEVEQSRVW